MTVAHLPYFDSQKLQKIIYFVKKLKMQKKTNKIITKAPLMATGHIGAKRKFILLYLFTSCSDGTIFPQKHLMHMIVLFYPVWNLLSNEGGFIMTHLPYFCSHCCNPMVSRKCSVCHQCESFYMGLRGFLLQFRTFAF